MVVKGGKYCKDASKEISVMHIHSSQKKIVP